MTMATETISQFPMLAWFILGLVFTLQVDGAANGCVQVGEHCFDCSKFDFAQCTTMVGSPCSWSGSDYEGGPGFCNSALSCCSESSCRNVNLGGAARYQCVATSSVNCNAIASYTKCTQDTNGVCTWTGSPFEGGPGFCHTEDMKYANQQNQSLNGSSAANSSERPDNTMVRLRGAVMPNRTTTASATSASACGLEGEHCFDCSLFSFTQCTTMVGSPCSWSGSDYEGGPGFCNSALSCCSGSSCRNVNLGGAARYQCVATSSVHCNSIASYTKCTQDTNAVCTWTGSPFEGGPGFCHTQVMGSASIDDLGASADRQYQRVNGSTAANTSASPGNTMARLRGTGMPSRATTANTRSAVGCILGGEQCFDCSKFGFSQCTTMVGSPCSWSGSAYEGGPGFCNSALSCCSGSSCRNVNLGGVAQYECVAESSVDCNAILSYTQCAQGTSGACTWSGSPFEGGPGFCHTK